MPVPADERLHLTLRGEPRERLNEAAAAAGVPPSMFARRILEVVASHAGDHIDAWERVIDRALGLGSPQEALPLRRKGKGPNTPEKRSTGLKSAKSAQSGTKRSGHSPSAPNPEASGHEPATKGVRK